MVEIFLAFLAYLESIVDPQNTLGLFALFSLAVITDIGVPVPFVLETALLLTAYHLGPLTMQVMLIVIVLFLGRVGGSAVLYFLSRGLGNIFLNWVKRNFPAISKALANPKLNPNKWASLAIATSRLTPGVLQVTSIAAGAIRLRYDRFVLGIAIASLIYDGVMILLGYALSFGSKTGSVDFTVWAIIAILVILVILWPLTYFLIRRATKNNKQKQNPNGQTG